MQKPTLSAIHDPSPAFMIDAAEFPWYPTHTAVQSMAVEVQLEEVEDAILGKLFLAITLLNVTTVKEYIEFTKGR